MVETCGGDPTATEQGITHGCEGILNSIKRPHVAKDLHVVMGVFSSCDTEESNGMLVTSLLSLKHNS